MKYQELSTRQEEIFSNLTTICKDSDAFYFQDFPANEDEDTVYRIFNYRQASYTDFCMPDAHECRGITFEVSMYGNPIRLVSMPMQKFYNHSETPFAMVHDIFDTDPLLHVSETDVKADGSLISSAIHVDGMLVLKSKGSFASVQATESLKWLEHRPEIYNEVMQLTQNGYTVNFEWCSPDNRIILPYAEPHLKVLNIRNNFTGEYESRRDIGVHSPVLKSHMIELVSLPGNTWDEMIETVRKETGIEGYIVKFDNGLWVKIKTDTYKTLHHSKDSVNIPRRLFEACVMDATDDLKDMFGTDEVAMKLITDMEDFVRPIYNGICNDVETFYNDNKERSQKEYAIAAQAVLGKELNKFGLAMSLYNGKEIDYKSNLKKYWKSLGLKDEKI
ncbi:RNA ligase [Vibrio phage 2.275.O._10N.286.54.E11]|nr:RNA ligase [Vibrio phage 2.275.O._10N.286.54.E11]